MNGLIKVVVCLYAIILVDMNESVYTCAPKMESCKASHSFRGAHIIRKQLCQCFLATLRFNMVLATGISRSLVIKYQVFLRRSSSCVQPMLLVKLVLGSRFL